MPPCRHGFRAAPVDDADLLGAQQLGDLHREHPHAARGAVDQHALATGDTATKVSTLSKAMRIIDEGLKASLESHSAPALADNLRALYDHMVSRLFIANLHNNDVPLAEVAKLLGDLRATWAEIEPGGATAHADTRLQA